MLFGKKVACIIPARLQATRLPRKPLALLDGKPLIQHVYEAACRVAAFDVVAIATDSEEIVEAATSFEAAAFMTSPAWERGTQRLHEIAQDGRVEADIWVNWQGDEPFVDETMILELLQSIDQPGDLWTLKRKIASQEEFMTKSIVKIVTDSDGFALYFSRSPIPHQSEMLAYRHVGLYAYTDAALKKIATLPSHPLEEAESLEQLRWLGSGMKIRVHETQGIPLGIDTPQDLELARERLALK